MIPMQHAQHFSSFMVQLQEECRSVEVCIQNFTWCTAYFLDVFNMIQSQRICHTAAYNKQNINKCQLQETVLKWTLSFWQYFSLSDNMFLLSSKFHCWTMFFIVRKYFLLLSNFYCLTIFLIVRQHLVKQNYSIYEI